jgi:hypothetical protein
MLLLGVDESIATVGQEVDSGVAERQRQKIQMNPLPTFSLQARNLILTMGFSF